MSFYFGFGLKVIDDGWLELKIFFDLRFGEILKELSDGVLLELVGIVI